MRKNYITNRWRPHPPVAAAIKTQAVLYKGGKCKDCNNVFSNEVFEFHHRDPQMKVMAISEMIHMGLNLEDLKPELDKCDLLCANCHRVRTSSKASKKAIRKKMTLRQQFLKFKNEDATSPQINPIEYGERFL